MKRLLYCGLLSAACMAATGCGGGSGRQSLTIAIDSDTIVITPPAELSELELVADSDSIRLLPALPDSADAR